MPNPNKLIHKSRIEQEELQIQSELYALGQLPTKPPGVPHPARITSLLNQIYSLFSDHAVQVGKPSKLPADVFEELRKEYSNTSINKAKKMLSIKSIRRQGRWWWQFPLKAPSEAMTSLHKRLVREYNPVAEQLSNLRRPAAIELQEILKEHNLEITNMLAVQLMEKAGYQRPTTLHMKSTMGIVSDKVNGQWMWYWPNRDVQDWIEKKLRSGPMPHLQLSMEAWEENSWSFDLLKWARKAMPNIQWRIIEGVGVWVDINHQRGERVESVVEVDMGLSDESDRKIIVDFGDESVDHDLAPSDDKIDPPATVRKTVKLTSGIDLEIFE